MKKLSSKAKKGIIALSAVVLTAAIVVGIVFGVSRNSGDPVAFPHPDGRGKHATTPPVTMWA